MTGIGPLDPDNPEIRNVVRNSYTEQHGREIMAFSAVLPQMGAMCKPH